MHNFAPGVGKLTVFSTWLVLSSPLCPGGGGGAWLQMTEALGISTMEHLSLSINPDFGKYLSSPSSSEADTTSSESDSDSIDLCTWEWHINTLWSIINRAINT